MCIVYVQSLVFQRGEKIWYWQRIRLSISTTVKFLQDEKKKKRDRRAEEDVKYAKPLLKVRDRKGGKSM